MRYTKRNENYTGKERKLWELENEIEDGNLIELPKLYRFVYVLKYCHYYTDKGYYIETYNPLGYVIFDNQIGIATFKDNNPYRVDKVFMLKDYNLSWFTDRELAEKKLEELEK